VSEWKVEPLASHHYRDVFDCGEPSLSEWIKHQASQFEARDLAQVYVLTRGGDPRVLGYYSISACHVRFEGLPPEHVKRLPKKIAIPAALIGKLAVDQSLRGQGLGGVLLYDALARIRDLAESIGIRAVVVDAIDEHACEFYRHFKFIDFLDEPGRLFLPLSVVRKLSGVTKVL
jgi:GNAT superfamily N-acetyltransferase